jgi:F-box and leucine-rich repeat protein GRR1
MRELYLYMQHAEEQDLCTMLDACPGLTALTVRDNGNNLGDLNALLLGKRCPHLQKLTMSGMMGKVADDAVLLNVAENCADLRVLQIPMNNDVTDASLSALAEKCPLLEEVNVTSCSKVTDASLVSLSQHGRALKTLLVAGCPLITDAGVTAVMQGCPALVELKVGECRQVSKDVMRAVDVLNNTSNSYWE